MNTYTEKKEMTLLATLIIRCKPTGFDEAIEIEATEYNVYPDRVCFDLTANSPYQELDGDNYDINVYSIKPKISKGDE